jgi:protein regulator of cytokinesis 1
MLRGQKGEKRDPGKLLREEKMRKRIAKELPKVTAELRKVLEHWEDEYGRPFLVHGERYLDFIEDDETKAVPGPRAKTPAPTPTPSNASNSTLNRARSVNSIKPGPKGTAKTPTAASGTGTLRRTQTIQGVPTITKGSPSRLPARMPLSNLKHGGNSPDRPVGGRPESRSDTGSIRHANSVMRAPPPKMRDLLPPPELETPVNHYRAAGLGSSIVRQVEPEDVYDDRDLRYSSYRENSRPPSQDYYHHPATSRVPAERAAPPPQPPAAPVRQISNTSTVVSGSENWETYGDSEPEEDASDAYFARLRAARAAGKRVTPDEAGGYAPRAQGGSGGQGPKRLRGLPPAGHGQVGGMVDHEGNRIVSGSEWTDEDGY